MPNKIINGSVNGLTGYTAAVTIDATNDYLLIQQGGVYKSINRNTLLGVSGTPADISTAQSFTNKTFDNSNILTLRRDRFTLQDSADTTKQANFILSGITTATTRSYTLPNVSDTLVSLTATQTLTNKTLTSPTITGGTISNATITVDSIAGFSTSTIVSVGGVQMNNGVIGTANAVVTNNIADTAVTPAKLQAGAGTGWAWQSWTPTLSGITLGNGTMVAKFTQIGKSVFFDIFIRFGTTSAMGTGPGFTLPNTAASKYLSGNYFIGTSFADSGTGGFPLYVEIRGSQTIGALESSVASGTYTQTGSISSTTPFTWGNTNTLSINGFYEAA